MRKTFSWYFQPTQAQIKEIWKTGVLTVDTNVLLDLYRYHEDTRQALLGSLKSFKGRTWLTYQVADEFFRNRNGVILSSASAFSEAERNISEIRKSIEEPLKRLKSNRIIPDELEEKLEKSLSEAILKAERDIQSVRDKFPDYFKTDPILDSICTLFASCIGPAYTDEALQEMLKEGKRRKENRIPPGFKDSGKEGEKPYGDFIIWRQTMDYIKDLKKPLIFVTSEQKEDWWEKSAGRTVGPLYELLREFHVVTGQRFLLYRTDRFLEFASKNSGKKANTQAVAEILDVVSQRSSSTAKVLFQNYSINERERACGRLIVELHEPVNKFNVSGHFEPELSAIPSLKVNLVEFPSDIPKYTIRQGTGTTFDFHIYLKSNDYRRLLPPGKYVFEFDAIIEKNPTLE